MVECRNETERNAGDGDVSEIRSVRRSQPCDENSMENVPGCGKPTCKGPETGKSWESQVSSI